MYLFGKRTGNRGFPETDGQNETHQLKQQASTEGGPFGPRLDGGGQSPKLGNNDRRNTEDAAVELRRLRAVGGFEACVVVCRIEHATTIRAAGCSEV